LIRAHFGIDPGALEDEEWARLFGQAVWLEGWRLKNQAELLSTLFGGKGKRKKV